MEPKDKVALTREWIMLMLYGTPKSLDELLVHGCKIMVYGHEYDDFIEIVGGLITDKHVIHPGENYALGQKGIFYVKKHVIIPFLDITDDPDKLESFIAIYRERCDTDFLKNMIATSCVVICVGLSGSGMTEKT